MSVRHHAEWLSLIEISGPFLSMPVLMQVFPQGLDADDPDHRRELYSAYEEWHDNQLGLRPETSIHGAWIRYVLTETLEFRDDRIAEGQSIPQDLRADFAEYSESLRPDFAILDPSNNRPYMLIQYYPTNQKLNKPVTGRPWIASPDTRMMELLHATDIPLGLVTNGEQWMLVHAPKGETTGFISWYASLWFDEHITLRAFRSLLNMRRFFGVSDDKTIEAMLLKSEDEQQEVTDQLGYQVRQAVEVLVQTMDRADREADGRLLNGITESELYESALTVMMRLVFLFSAEERGLFPLDDEFYHDYYAASSLRAQLREAADQVGEEVIERRFDAWCRLLATFRMIHKGVDHDRFSMRPYGGSLFDPDRFSFLEGRTAGVDFKDSNPLPIDNRTVLHLLEALQLLQVKVPGSAQVEARRLSFKALDIEQIGHVYEGLLDHTAKRSETVILGLKGTKDKEPETPLPELEVQLAKGEGSLISFLNEQTGRTANPLRNALKLESDVLSDRSLRVACGNDRSIYERVLPFAGLIRDDAFGHPVVILPGSVYVTAGVERRKTGTHYTPRSLTEPIVQHTLEPLIYDGAVDGKPREKWKLKKPSNLLNLKICDMAMGSGAFLVQVCRYLSERLVEAWENVEKVPQGSVMITPEGEQTDDFSKAIPADIEGRLLEAKRFIAEKCLYGVDKNPLAVEMAKLSLWLITLDKNRPFTFLDHALKCGDSIIGITLDQLKYWSLNTTGTLKIFGENLKMDVQRMIDLRREIENLPDNIITDQTHKAFLLNKAEAIANNLRSGGDMLLGSYCNDLLEAKQEDLRNVLLTVYQGKINFPDDLREQVDLKGIHPFHWELEFPEVFLDGDRKGFDAFVGNPPFMGGQYIGNTLGACYSKYLKNRWNHARGSADYSTYFFLQATEKLRQNGTLGLIATNTIAQGCTRQLGLDYIYERGNTIYNAINNQNWPGMAAVIVSVIHIYKGQYKGKKVLDEEIVDSITPVLDSARFFANPYKLTNNANKSFQGSNALGMGFTMLEEEALSLIKKNARNKEVLFHYLNGEDLNSNPDQSPSRWIINFFDWPLCRDASGSWFNADEKQKNKWLSNGIVPYDYPDHVAEDYPDCISIVREKVYPERQKNRDKQRREIWWRFTRPTIKLYNTIAHLERTLVIALTSKTMAFVFQSLQSKEMVFSHATIVISTDSSGIFCILQSNLHIEWAKKFGSSMKGDSRYTPTDCFETFPFPKISSLQEATLDNIGENYHEHRKQIMLTRWEGLTQTYNRFHKPDEQSEDIKHLRKLHVQMDHAVADAYGWNDLDLGHGFHETQQGIRYTISDPARLEVLDRLLLLNHQRHEEEVKAGLHDKKKAKRKAKTSNDEPGLF